MTMDKGELSSLRRRLARKRWDELRDRLSGEAGKPAITIPQFDALSPAEQAKYRLSLNYPTPLNPEPPQPGIHVGGGDFVATIDLLPGTVLKVPPGATVVSRGGGRVMVISPAPFTPAVDYDPGMEGG